MARVITALNGRLPQSALAPIGGGFYLRKDAAASYLAARSAGCPWGVNTAYRTLAEQAKLYAKYLAGGPLAAKPGTSWHGEGLALDIPSASGAQQWLLSHPEYGWRRTVMPAEPWHFEFFPDLYVEDDMPTLPEIASAVWNATLGKGDNRRTTGAILQSADLAARRAEAKVDTVLAAVKAIPGVNAAALAKAVAERVAAIEADAVLDELHARLKD